MKKDTNDLSSKKQLQIINFLFGRLIHDFNNLLSIIYGYTQLVEHDMNEAGLASKNIAQVKDASSKAVMIIRKIILFKAELEKIEESEELTYEKMLDLWMEYKDKHIQ